MLLVLDELWCGLSLSGRSTDWSHVCTAGRYQYDPNQRVQDAMGHIWRSLVDDPKKTVDAHFGAIMSELLREMGGRLWRNRQAACAALSDLLQGRRWVGVFLGIQGCLGYRGWGWGWGSVMGTSIALLV